MRLLFALAMTVISTVAAAGSAGNDIVIGQKNAIQSAILEERRDYWIYLPPQYQSELYAQVRYPVIYVLDGDANFHLYSGVIDHMISRGAIPPVIMVGIANTDRGRDMTPTHSTVDWTGKAMGGLTNSGGAERFLRFIQTELIARVESDYRAAPHRTLIGHSLAGLATMYSLTTQPGLFQGYIAIDSSLWWHDQFMVRRLREKPIDLPDDRTRVFMSLADHATTGDFDGSNMILGNMRFAELLRQRAPSLEQRVKLRHFEGEDHGSVVLPTLHFGLAHVFEGYEAGVELTWYSSSTEPLIAHFKAVSRKLGYEVLPPEPMVDQVGHGIHGARQMSALAVEFLQLNVRNYPNSSHAWSSLADLYAKLGETETASDHYRRALELKSRNQDARAGLEALRKMSR